MLREADMFIDSLVREKSTLFGITGGKDLDLDLDLDIDLDLE